MDEKVGPVSHRWASAFSPLGSDCQATSDAAFSTFVRLRAQAVLLAPEVTILTERKRVAALAAAAHLPSIYSFRECVEEGVIRYGINLRENWRRAAAYVDKTLKGAYAGELPLEFPTKLELLIDLAHCEHSGLQCRLRCSRKLTKWLSEQIRARTLLQSLTVVHGPIPADQQRRL